MPRHKNPIHTLSGPPTGVLPWFWPPSAPGKAVTVRLGTGSFSWMVIVAVLPAGSTR